MELIAYCRDSRIPTIITSAGITNVIAAVLEEHGISTIHDDHFHIDANHMEFHLDDGTLQKILPHIPVHSYAKKHVHKRAPHMFTTISHSIDGELVENSDSWATSTSMVNLLEQEDAILSGSSLPEKVHHIAVKCISDAEPVNKKKLHGVAAIILGDNAGDFEVLKELSDVNEAYLFRLGYAVNKEKADKLMLLDCCDVILIGDEHNAEVVLMLLKNLVELREKSKMMS